MEPKLANMIRQLGLDPAFVMSPQGVSVLQQIAQMAQRAQLPQSGAEELKRTDPYGVI